MQHLKIELIKLWEMIKTSKNWKLFLAIGIISLVILNLTDLVKALLAMVGLISLAYSLYLAWPILVKKFK